jgi:4-amino-4-deoxy-L-arabinose transferase-like glycosyltransferase
MKNKKILTAVLVTLVVALGLFLRTYNINHAPSGIFPDEAMNGEDAIKANNSGHYELFYPANEGREGLFINLIALSFKLFGISIFALKLPAIILSTLTILGTYLLARELFRKERIALISAFLVAVSFWSINFGRISFRANMLPFALVFSFYFLFRGIRTRKWLDFAISGLLFGMGAHTYIAWRIAPLILFVLLAVFVLSRKNFIKEYWKHALVFILLFFITTLPIVYALYANPTYLHAPVDDISIFSPQINKGNLAGTFFRSFSLSLIKYNFWGDQNWRHNYPPYPILDPLTGIAFLFGIIFSGLMLFRKLYRRIKQKIRDPELEIHAFLILWFFIMLAPEFLSSEGLPHALRSIGNLPVVFIFGALTFNFFLEKAEKHKLIFRKITLSLTIFMLLVLGVFNALKYHYFWANNPKVAESFNKNLTDISKYIQTLPAQKEKFIINSFGPYHSPLDRLPIQIFNLNLPGITYLYSWQGFDQIKPKTNDFIIILTGKDADTENRLKRVFPDLTLQEITPSPGSIYYILK